jgi:hypothetical protein
MRQMCNWQLRVVLVGLLGLALPALAQEEFDSEINISLDQLLPKSLIASGEHRVSNFTFAGTNSIIFEVDSDDTGTQYAESLALAVIRIHEARSLAQAINQFKQDARKRGVDARGEIRIGGDSALGILFNPLKTSANVAGQFTDNVGQTLTEFGEFPDPDDQASNRAAAPVADVIFASHRRSVASQLKLDVYSSNPAVQRFLDTVARARESGQIRAGISLASAARGPEVEVENGALRERVRRTVLNQEQQTLFNKSETMLLDAGIDARLARLLMDHPVLTPTHKYAMTEYVAFMQQVGNRSALIEAAIGANNEVQALSKIRIARMYAYYHQNWVPLRTLISAGHLALAINRDGALLVALPFDYLDWTPENARIFSGLAEFAERKNIKSKVVLLSGITTERASAGLDALGFLSLERFLFAQ